MDNLDMYRLGYCGMEISCILSGCLSWGRRAIINYSREGGWEASPVENELYRGVAQFG